MDLRTVRVTRPRGFIALHGDVFDDDAPPRRPWRELFRSDALWIGASVVCALWMLAQGSDQAHEGRWSAAAFSWALGAFNVLVAWRRALDWKHA